MWACRSGRLTVQAAALLVALGSSTAVFGCATGATGCTPFAVEGDFEHKPGRHDLSAIDCMPAQGDDGRLCVAGDDELKRVQFATLHADRLVAGTTVKIFDDAHPPILGTAPTAAQSCPGGEDDGEMDAEAIAYAEPYFYVAGSHGCSRENGEYRPETFVLARLKQAADGAISVERTYRLSEALGRVAAIKDNFAKPLSGGGVNIEGVEVQDGVLLAGLRAPASDHAFIVGAPVDALFAPGADKLVSAEDAEPIKLELGKNMGVRDMDFLPDGRLLVLSGPAGESAGVYSLTAFKRSEDGKLFEKVGHAKDLPVSAGGGSPEAIEWLGDTNPNGNVLVISDGSINGGPYTTTLP